MHHKDRPMVTKITSTTTATTRPMVSFRVSVKPVGERRGACEDEDELAVTVAVAVAAGSESTVGITDDGVKSVFGKFDCGKITVGRSAGRMDVGNASK